MIVFTRILLRTQLPLIHRPDAALIDLLRP
jgi:hypothetical protein